MVKNFAQVGAWDYPHAAVFLICIVDGQPGRYCKRRFQSPVSHVLMPGHKLISKGRVFTKEMCGEEENVWPDNALNMFQNYGVGG